MPRVSWEPDLEVIQENKLTYEELEGLNFEELRGLFQDGEVDRLLEEHGGVDDGRFRLALFMRWLHVVGVRMLVYYNGEYNHVFLADLVINDEDE